MKLFINNITKSYGNNLALSNFTAEFQPGIYALLGPNGSGKTTLMNIITDNLKADSGEILYDDGSGNGENVLKMGVRFREKLGFIPQYPGLYPNFTVERFLLKKGVIVDNAPPGELIKKIEGKVWHVPCDESEVSQLQSKLRVISISRDPEKGDVILRILSDEKPTERAYNVSPSLEDYYLYVFDDIAIAASYS